MDSEKIFANDVTDQDLNIQITKYTKIYKQLIKFNSNKNPLKNVQKTEIDISPKKTYCSPIVYEKMPIIIIIREMKIRATILQTYKLR